MKDTAPTGWGCVHSWSTLAADHQHRCSGLPSCHEAPCVCAICAAEDWCVTHPITSRKALTCTSTGASVPVG